MMTGGLMSKVAIAERNNGLAVELLKRLDAYQGSRFLASRPEVPIDPELTKLMLDRMVIEEAGAEVRFGTGISEVVVEGRRIKAVVIDGLEGLQAVVPKFSVDCTGDGQLGFKAGASYMVGGNEGFGSSPTLMFRVANCDIEALISFMEKNPPERMRSNHISYSNHLLTPAQNRANIANDLYAHFADFIPYIEEQFAKRPGRYSEWEKRTLTNRGVLFMNQPQPGHVLVNCTRIPNFKGNDALELRRAMVEGRRQVECIFKFMKEYLPGFEKSYIMDTGSLLGIRESRRLTGDYVFTENDVNGLARFDDAVVSNHGGVEIHSVNGKGTDIRELAKEAYYNVPYRCIISKDFDNLYMAGRCFSSNHPGLSAARNIAYCIALGQAAGSAGAQLVKAGKENVRAVDMKKLQGELKDII
jgi:hypothetical protein